MIPFNQASLISDGRVPMFVTESIAPEQWVGAQGYTATFPIGSTSPIANTDVYVDSARYLQNGILRLYDATSAMPAQYFSVGGFSFTSDGQLCVTTGAPDSTVQYIGGVAVRQDGAVHIVNVTPAAWYRYGIGLTDAGGGACSAWDDQSGSGRNLTAAGAARPTIQADKSLLFDGVANVMATAGFTLNQPTTVYFLGKQVTWTATDTIFDGNGPNSGRAQQLNVTPEIDLRATNIVAANTNWAVNTYAAIAAVYSGASSVLQINNTTPTTGDVGAGNMGGLTLAATGSGVVNFGNIQVKEVILFPTAHDAATRAIVITYLAAVGGLNI